MFNLKLQQNEFLDDIFNILEHNVAIEKTNLDSSPGLDRIEYKRIKALSNKCRLLLSDILNELYISKVIPEDENECQVLLIKKLTVKTFVSLHCHLVCASYSKEWFTIG